ncbi:MAG: alpha/beta hydrolase family protein [Niveispirillum sp.]|uniref:alpha/beta hydrolase family protein n=1 Tax=Niveispirillum sp. TaxID=1917217 RepID=UPI004036450B
MTKRMSLTAAFFALSLPLTAMAQTAPVPAAPPNPAAVMEADVGLPAHTLYRPANLSAVKGKLPIIAWGNGGCADIGNAFKTFLTELAAQGYLVLAGGPINQALESGASMRDLPRTQNNTDQMFRSIDWAIAENDRKGSPYFGRLDTRKIAVMGQSCGGLQAIAAGGDKRVSTVVVLNSGIIRGGIPNPDGTIRQPAGVVPATEPDLLKLHTPVLYLIGGPKDQAYKSAETDFDAIQGLPVFNGNLDVGHGGTWREAGGGAMGSAVIDWLNWHLKNIDKASATFTGTDCTLCKDPKWTVKKKNMP